MLVLSRKLNETVKIGDDIEVTVAQISRGRVRLAIQAPREVPILRSELSTMSEANRKVDRELVAR